MSGPPKTNDLAFIPRWYGRRFTLSAWLKPDDGCDGRFMQSKVGNLDIKRGTDGWELNLWHNSRSRPELRLTNSEFASITKLAGVTGPWHQLVLVEDKEGALNDWTKPGALKLFIDGRLAKMAVITTNVLRLPENWIRGSGVAPTNETFWTFVGCGAVPNEVIGPSLPLVGQPDPNAPTEPDWGTIFPAYAGLVDDLRVYDRAFTDAEVRVLFDSERAPAMRSKILPNVTTGKVRLLTGIRPGATFRLESSTDLVRWFTQGFTETPRPEGMMFDISTTDPKRFFRFRDIQELPNDRPRLVKQPERLAGVIGQDLALEVKVSGEEPIGYTWLRVPDRGPFAGKIGLGTVIAGATGAKLRFPNASRSDSGLYCVAFSNRFSTNITFSAVVRVDVGLPPTIISGPTDVDLMYMTDPKNPRLSWFSSYTKGTGRSLQASATGDPPLAFEWWEGKSTGQAWNPQPNGNTFIDGNVMWSYQVDPGPFTVSTSSLDPQVAYLNNGSCWAVVTNLFGRATTDTAVIRFFVQPVINSESPDQTIVKGGSVKLTVKVRGTPNFFARWYLNGSELPTDGLNPTVPVASATGDMVWVATKSGSYHAVICNAWGCVTSRTIKVAGP